VPSGDIGPDFPKSHDTSFQARSARLRNSPSPRTTPGRTGDQQGPLARRTPRRGLPLRAPGSRCHESRVATKESQYTAWPLLGPCAQGRLASRPIPKAHDRYSSGVPQVYLRSAPRGTKAPCGSFYSTVLVNHERTTMRPILLWLVGIPIPVIILLYLFHVL
jgi:hypothetical protein